MNIKKDDNVIIIAGKDKGMKGSVIKALPKENKVIVSGVNILKKHSRPTKSGQKGQIIEKTMPINVSNVMLVDAKTGKGTRVGKKMIGDKKVRISKKTGNEI